MYSVMFLAVLLSMFASLAIVTTVMLVNKDYQYVLA